MDSHSRLTATRYIWTAFFFGLLVVNGSAIFNGDGYNIFNFFASVLVVVAAISATGFVWNWGSLSSESTSHAQAERSSKGKRRNRVDALLSIMDEDEIEAIRQRLSSEEFDEPVEVYIGEDGELVQR